MKSSFFQQRLAIHVQNAVHQYTSPHFETFENLRIWKSPPPNRSPSINWNLEYFTANFFWKSSISISSLMSGPHGTNGFFSSNQQGHQFIFTLQGSPDQSMLPMEATSARVGCTSTHERRQYIQYEHLVCKPHILCLTPFTRTRNLRWY